MIKLIKPLNYRGGLLEAGAILTLGELEHKLIANGSAEKYKPVTEEAGSTAKDENDLSDEELEMESVLEILQAKTKAELLVIAEQAGIEVADNSKKGDIVAVLIDKVKNGLVLNLDAKDAD